MSNNMFHSFRRKHGLPDNWLSDDVEAEMTEGSHIREASVVLRHKHSGDRIEVRLTDLLFFATLAHFDVGHRWKRDETFSDALLCYGRTFTVFVRHDTVQILNPDGDPLYSATYDGAAETWKEANALVDALELAEVS